jgi:hypothetical protein
VAAIVLKKQLGQIFAWLCGDPLDISQLNAVQPMDRALYLLVRIKRSCSPRLFDESTDCTIGKIGDVIGVLYPDLTPEAAGMFALDMVIQGYVVLRGEDNVIPNSREVTLLIVALRAYESGGSVGTSVR